MSGNPPYSVQALFSCPHISRRHFLITYHRDLKRKLKLCVLTLHESVGAPSSQSLAAKEFVSWLVKFVEDFS